MTKTTYIFDFDGTLVDSPQLVVSYYNQLAERRGWQQVTDQNIEKFRSQTIDQGLSQLGVPSWELALLPARVRWQMWWRADEIQLIEGMAQVLQQLQSAQVPLGVLSSNQQLVVQKILKQLKQIELFSFVKAQPVKRSKAALLEKTLTKHSLEPDQAIYISDDIRDIDACQKVGMTMVGVSWGVNNAVAFGKYPQVPVAHHPSELLEIFRQFDRSLQ